MGKPLLDLGQTVFNLRQSLHDLRKALLDLGKTRLRRGLIIDQFLLRRRELGIGIRFGLFQIRFSLCQLVKALL